jgi:LysR family transcriptional regulator, regulator for bpeEF and oprC
MPMDRLETMRSFVSVVETGSFTQAAVQLGRNKSTVSDQVASLEAFLGVRLLNRTTRTVVPTPEGLRYARKAGAILASVDEADATLKTRTRNPQGLLKVEMPSPIGHLLVAPQIHTFLTQYPRITLDLNCTERFSDMLREGVDCVLRGGVLPDSSMVCRKLGDLEFALFAAPAYLTRFGVPNQPSDLAQHYRIGYRNAAGNEVQTVGLMRQGERVDLDIPMRLIVSDVVTSVAMGLAGLGIVHATNFTMAQYLKAGTMVRVLPDWRGRVMPLTLLSPSNRFRTSRVQVFMDWLQDLLQRSISHE